MTKGGFLTGPSQVCRLCIRYEKALNWSLGIALVVLIVSSLVTFNLLAAFVIAVVMFALVWIVLRKRVHGDLGRGIA